MYGFKSFHVVRTVFGYQCKEESGLTGIQFSESLIGFPSDVSTEE